MGEIWRHLQELLKHGIITESKSPYSLPIVITRKKNGKLCMCIDYQVLNTRTIVDQYVVPRVQEVLDCHGGSKCFFVLDLRSIYYQIPLREADEEKPTFICLLGLFQFERMPQDISGDLATFQRLIEKVVGDMHLTQVLVYLDGRTLEEHDEGLL